MSDVTDGSMPLSNPRHEAFAIWLAEGLSLSHAYRKAGYEDSPGIRTKAFRLGSKTSIRHRVAYLIEWLLVRASIAVEETDGTPLGEAEIDAGSSVQGSSSATTTWWLQAKRGASGTGASPRTRRQLGEEGL